MRPAPRACSSRAPPPEVRAAVREAIAEARGARARSGGLGPASRPEPRGLVVIVSGGTSDGPVVHEARIRAELLGYDRGGARGRRRRGPPSTGDALPDIARADCVVVVAGMEAALASVVGGLAPCPIIGVPDERGLRLGARRDHGAERDARVVRGRPRRRRDRRRARGRERRGADRTRQERGVTRARLPRLHRRDRRRHGARGARGRRRSRGATHGPAGRARVCPRCSSRSPERRGRAFPPPTSRWWTRTPARSAARSVAELRARDRGLDHLRRGPRSARSRRSAGWPRPRRRCIGVPVGRAAAPRARLGRHADRPLRGVRPAGGARRSSGWCARRSRTRGASSTPRMAFFPPRARRSSRCSAAPRSWASRRRPSS